MQHNSGAGAIPPRVVLRSGERPAPSGRQGKEKAFEGAEKGRKAGLFSGAFRSFCDSIL